MSELLSQLQQLGDGEIGDLSIAHDASEEIVALRLRVAELVEALARCRHQAGYSIGEEDALRIQLGKARDIVNETLSALPAHRKQEPTK